MNIIDKICPKCGNIHNKPGKFCSRSCGNSRSWTEESKRKLSEKLKGVPQPNNHGRGLKPRIEKFCLTCNGSFFATEKNGRKYCCKECGMKSPNQGGYREGSGRAKTGYYKGIYCGSTYELAWVIYQTDNQKEFTRFSSTLEFEGKKYIPDFLQDGKIIEIKGYESPESVALKTNVANKNGYEVIVLRKDDLKDIFAWVKERYSYKHLQELYDDHKPKFQYTCDFCGDLIDREFKSKTKQIFCSRSCVGKNNGDGISEETKRKISNSLTEYHASNDKVYIRTVKQMWITDETIDKLVHLDAIIPLGFRRGRKFSTRERNP